MGIVDGTMGILSRKMALEGSNNLNNLSPINYLDPVQPFSPSFQRPLDLSKYDKALGNKSYTHQRNEDLIQHSMSLLIDSAGESKAFSNNELGPI